MTDEIEKAFREYHPCSMGLHICGQIEDEDGARPLTLRNIPASSMRSARKALVTLRGEFEATPDERGQVMVDLFDKAGDLEDQFEVSRQMVDRVVARANGILSRKRREAPNGHR